LHGFLFAISTNYRTRLCKSSYCTKNDGFFVHQFEVVICVSSVANKQEKNMPANRRLFVGFSTAGTHEIPQAAPLEKPPLAQP
jgi:hypothetical protein